MTDRSEFSVMNDEFVVPSQAVMRGGEDWWGGGELVFFAWPWTGRVYSGEPGPQSPRLT